MPLIPYATTIHVRDNCLCLHAQRAAHQPGDAQRERDAQASPAAQPTPAPAKQVAAAAPVAAKRKLSYKEQREYDALPALIAALETEQAAIGKDLEDGQLFHSDPARAAQLGARHAEVEGEWLQALERWEALGGS